MRTVAIHYDKYGALWQQLLAERLPGFDVRLWPDWGALDEIDYAVAWTPPHGLLRQCTNLKGVFSIGAGVDQLLVDPQFPRHVPLVRMTDAVLAAGMAEYVTLTVLALHRDLLDYLEAQRASSWAPLAQRYPDEITVGLMGFGTLGRACAEALKPFGYRLAGWSRSRKQADGVTCYAGSVELGAFLAGSTILIVLLPLTNDTRGMLNDELLSQLPTGADVVNVARGAVLDIETVRPMLDDGRLGRLWLDVHHTEPLPADHWSWRHPKVVITPHIAAATLPRTAAGIVAAGIERMETGELPEDVVDFDKGY